MQTEKAIALNEFLSDAADLVLSTVNNGFLVPKGKINSISELTEECFENHFAAFEGELQANILEFKEYDIVYNYIQHYLAEIDNWIGFDADFVKQIFVYNQHVNELIKAKQLIEKYKQQISDYLEGKYFKGDLINKIHKLLHPEWYEKPEKQVFVPDIKYDFEELKKELTNKDAKLTTLQKIAFINDRHAEFKQWQTVHDTDNVYDYHRKVIGKKHPITEMHYPHFTQLCVLEIGRLENALKLENDRINQKAIEKNSVIIKTSEKPPYKWNSSDSDFLELFAALYQNESVVRVDGNALTRKEMLEYFQGILGMEIKDTEGRLTKVGNRENNTAFLDTLAQQFRNYVAGKAKKLQSRK